MLELLLAIGGFLVLLGLLVVVRIKSNSKFEIRTPDIVLALVPIALWLFMTGKISAFELGDLKITRAIEEASQAPVSAEIVDLAPLPVEELEVAAKGGVGQIPDLIRRKVNALAFQLGAGAYWGPAISDYFRLLTQQPFLKYVVINRSDGTFFGMADARRMAQLIQEGQLQPEEFATWLNDGEGSRVAEELPGFLGADVALDSDAGRLDGLARMDSLGMDALPVLDDARRLAGVVERSKLTASMLIEIATKAGYAAR